LRLPSLGEEQFNVVYHATNIYPKAVRELVGIKDTTVYDIVVALWGKGSGKDFCSRVSISRIAYLLYCLKDPQATFGMASADSIDAINMAYTAYQARNIFFEPLKRLLLSSPWFKNRHHPTGNQIVFPKGIIAHSGNSAQESFEGFNPILVVLDEIDAFKTKEDLRRHGGWNPEHSAEGVYNALRSSGQSRFPGLAKTVLLSFLRRPDGFMIQEYKKALNDESAYASGGPGTGATWNINPTKTRKDFDREFARNPEDSAMRYQCIPTATAENFFRNRELIYETFYFDDHTEQIKKKAPRNPFQEGAFLPGYKISRHDNAFRYIHVDTGITNDAASVCCTHIKQTINQYGQDVPVAEIDFIAHLDPKEIGEIMLDDIRDVIREFRRRKEGPPIQMVVTFDQYQSRDSMQILAAEGITTGYISVDKNDEPWVVLKDYIYTYRLLAPGSTILPLELRTLVKIRGNKVDHPTGGSKDAADSLAGSIWLLNEDWHGEIETVIMYDHRLGIGEGDFSIGGFDESPGMSITGDY